MHEIIKYRKDYTKPNYQIHDTKINFTIHNNHSVTVINTSKFKHNSKHNSIRLNGESTLVSLKIDDKTLSTSEYTVIEDGVLLENLPEEFTLEVVTQLDPELNQSCMGLYQSNRNIFTQCEPDGFRKITYFLDRPDVSSTYTVTITAPIASYPTLLSNGNLISHTKNQDMHTVVWHDPFPKPSYLFALVAGSFAKISKEIISKSGKKINLEVYSEAQDIDKCQFALESLENAIRFDENRFSLEYDLDTYMIVASPDFNMGAMENKGLNIFNTKYVLADKEIATDEDFVAVEAVVGHEYFHNWTGNRVTCRDWFQLSLKEGLTVFRDQEFTANSHDKTVKRIKDVKLLRTHQFAEDASNLAHPIRPDFYVEMNNFYTVTVYEKGAEVVRMYETLLGREGFKKGLSLYLSKHDGHAATCGDFYRAMTKANYTDFGNFRRWYSQSGTPIVKCSIEHNTEKDKLIVTMDQSNPDSLNQKDKKSVLIPVNFALFDKSGNKITIPEASITGNYKLVDGELVLLLDHRHNVFKFNHIDAEVTPSLLRNFSAPVILNYDYTIEELIVLATHDDDLFNRYEAMQRIYRYLIFKTYSKELSREDYDRIISTVIKNITKLLSSDANQEFIMMFTTLPTSQEIIPIISENLTPGIADSVHIHHLKDVIDNVIIDIFSPIADVLITKYQELFGQINRSYDYKDKRKRSLKNHILHILGLIAHEQVNSMALHQYQSSDNMTDRIASLLAVNNLDNDTRNKLFDMYATYYKNEALAMDKWFALHAISRIPNRVPQLQQLMQHRTYQATNPNKIYSLLRMFTSNLLEFNNHSGYAFITEQIKIVDKFNPSVAGRLAYGFAIINQIDHKYTLMAQPYIQDILDNDPSHEVAEILSKIIDILPVEKV